jgi:hypothetical protein
VGLDLGLFLEEEKVSLKFIITSLFVIDWLSFIDESNF